MIRHLASTLLLTIPGVALAQSQSVDPPAWLAGCWESDVRGRHVAEQWMKPAGGMMLGMARTVSGDEVRNYEFTLIRRGDDGALYYVAQPSGQMEAAFKQIKSGPGEVVFENPDHDYPQRIIYRLHDGDSLNARVEGLSEGRELAFDYPLKRVSCD